MRGKSLSEKIAESGHRLAIDAHAAWIAARHPKVALLARLIAILVAAYALSPIDLVPDFIPVLGWIDDLMIVPLGLWVARRLIPDDLWAECHDQAATAMERPSVRAGMWLIITIWAALLFLLYWTVKSSPLH